MSDLPSRLADIVGPSHVLTAASDVGPYLHEPREKYAGRALCVVRPGTREEVAAILGLCHETATPVVPQGGNTGLVGGQTPDDARAVVLATTRLAALRDIDPVSNTMTVEAGMTLQAARDAAEQVDRLFPLWIAAGGSCTIGGNLATNAGGLNVIAHGNARELVNGLEVVLADGRVLSALSKLKKDNTGYDLKNLFIGSEGTLGIITAAVLRLAPRPRATATAFVGLADPQAALDLLDLARGRAAGGIEAFELIPRIAIDFVLEAFGGHEPLADKHPWYALIELTSFEEDGLDARLLALLEEGADRGLVADAAVAASLDQREKLWALRESISDAQKHFGGSIKHDVSVPLASVPAFLAAVVPVIEAVVPGARLCAFGHLGDGNIHCNVQQPIGGDKAAFLARWDDMSAAVHGLVQKLGGSISAEHGIGQMKRDLLPGVKDPVALDVMRSIKATLDPKGILNPGKVL
ncbi:FAD linked oxidase domain protein [Beijerinckiaceae bacterium RH AL1]|nr:FAD-binding oxidoreductase [Beijerinckiaceae bacterium]VVB45238.1 FAD linked oxidase domain protein [Beijerinckiaceae bacterium RH CH11]VVB45317.1 FAD linked oxidase domain protein [Beijerinckiaceae bacterium RH AL8]VVC54765.1 FAD linked oxidase domain protein [Beijerinckiaceae bacterium RH AL1]